MHLKNEDSRTKGGASDTLTQRSVLVSISRPRWAWPYQLMLVIKISIVVLENNIKG